MKTINIYKGGWKIYHTEIIMVVFQKDGSLEVHVGDDDGECVIFQRDEYDWFNIV